jgi:hypothetical protein
VHGRVDDASGLYDHEIRFRRPSLSQLCPPPRFRIPLAATLPSCLLSLTAVLSTGPGVEILYAYDSGAMTYHLYRHHETRERTGCGCAR